MAYGKGASKGLLKRMIHLGSQGLMPDHALLDLRRRYIAAATRMAQAVWPADPLDDLGEDYGARLLAAQAAEKGFLNSVWAEKARIAVQEHVAEQHKRRFRRLIGRLRHCRTLGDDGWSVTIPRPEAEALSAPDLEAIVAWADGPYTNVRIRLRAVMAGGSEGLSQAQVAAIRAVHRAVTERFAAPRYDQRGGTVVQLHLDYRCVQPVKGGYQSALTDVGLSITAMRADPLAQRGEAVGFTIAAPVARGETIRITAAPVRAPLDRLFAPEQAVPPVGSLVLEIGPDRLVVKAVLGTVPAVAFTLDEAACLQGHDVNMVETLVWATVPKDGPIDPALLARLPKMGREECREHLAGGQHPADRVFSAKRWSGRRFLGLVARHAARIDALRSEIDRLYNRIQVIRGEIGRLLDLPVGQRIVVGMAAERVPGDVRVGRLERKFFRLLGAVQRLKGERIALYDRIAAVKRCWFGHVANRAVENAVAHQAACVFEDLDYEAIEREDPGYRGRAFNRVLNDSARGQLSRCVQDKLVWRGIPVLRIPSWWTSSTDVRYGHVAKSQRSGARFVSAVDGRAMHADDNAALTIAVWLLLRPKPRAVEPGLAA